MALSKQNIPIISAEIPLCGEDVAVAALAGRTNDRVEATEFAPNGQTEDGHVSLTGGGGVTSLWTAVLEP